MRKSLGIFRVFVCLLCLAAALAFIVIEGWLIITGDWQLFENSTLALLRYSVRALLALYAFILSIFALFKKRRSFLWEGLGLLAASFVSLPFVSNNLAWLFVLLSLLFVLSGALTERFCKTV